MTNSNYVVKDESGKVLFALDNNGPVKIGDKFGFNMDNAPLVYAIFTITSIENNILTVTDPERYDKATER